MATAPVLVRHALMNVWCAPRQDMQAIVQPSRLTKPTGAWNTITVMWEKIQLPVLGKRFHVFQVGQLHPALMGLFDVQNQWVSLADAAVRMRLITDVYNVSGIQMPRFQSWYRVTEDKNLIFAIMHQDTIPFNCGTEDTFIRIYTNAYFQMNRENDDGLDIWVTGANPRSRAQILQVQNEFIKYQNKPGKVYAFVNGFTVDTIDLFTVQPGDVVEFVYDASIYKVVEFNIKDLPTFVSQLDLKSKYLLHYPSIGPQQIDYHDDLDFFLLNKQPTGRYKGVYYHRNANDAVRMVTHRDYSIPTPYVVGFADSDGQWHDPEEMVLRMHVRHGGWDRSLVFENNRIHELYKLPDDEIVGAMVGVNAVVDNWRAEVLEASQYAAIMRNVSMDITQKMVESAYGYNACSKVLADTPSLVRNTSGIPVADVPYGVRSGTTGYEYDDTGKLLNYNTHIDGDLYPCRAAKAKYVEFLNAYSDELLDEVYGMQRSPLDPNASYRFYICEIVDGIPNNKWVDVTGGPEYAIVDGYVEWMVNPDVYYTLVRSDNVVLAYKQLVRVRDGVIRVTLRQKARRNGEINIWPLQIPLGELDLWLNGYYMIEGLDYIVRFPEIVILNKNRLNKVERMEQELIIRFSGFCNKDLSRPLSRDTGFVNYGMLSRNKRYDIRDDKVLMITVGGAYRDRSELKFSEGSQGIQIDGVPNGTPYQIRDIVVPMRGMVTEETYAMRAKSMVIDKRVSDYLSARVVDEDFDTPSAIKERYQVVSPFFCKLMWDLKNNHLHDDRLYQQYGDDLVRELCTPYLSYLTFDPCIEANKVDDRYVLIVPHNYTTVVAISIYHFKFLTMVNRIYLGNKIDMSNNIRLLEAGE